MPAKLKTSSWSIIDHIMLIRRDLYGRDGAHLNKKGKQMMAQIKRHFQDA